MSFFRPNVESVEKMLMAVLYIKSIIDHSFTSVVEMLRKYCLVTTLYIKKNLLISLYISTNAEKPLADWINPVEDRSQHFLYTSTNASTFAAGVRA